MCPVPDHLSVLTTSPSSTSTTAASDSQLRSWTLSKSYVFVDAHLSGGIVVSAIVAWPDGSIGEYGLSGDTATLSYVYQSGSESVVSKTITVSGTTVQVA